MHFWILRVGASVAPERLLDAAMDEDIGCSLCKMYDGNAQCPCGIAVIGGEDNDATSSMHAVLTMAGCENS